MATRNQFVAPGATANVAPPPTSGMQLCDYCHQKPKFSNHAFCSKTCATQAATLCNYCHKKPKFQNFEYCGKNCANLANANGAAAAPTAATGLLGALKGAAIAATQQRQTPAAGQYKPAGGHPRQNQQQQQAAFDPVQIAKLVVQQMPQVQALLNGTNLGGGNNSHNAARSAPQAPVNNPFLNNAGSFPQAQAHVNANPNGVSGSIPFNSQQQQQRGYPSQQQPPDNLDCLIPGCGKPVHIDAKGLKTSDYCSQRHREEAVAKGLVSPCIMCLTRPQSHTDYFCSRACREESLNKHYEATEDEDTSGLGLGTGAGGYGPSVLPAGGGFITNVNPAYNPRGTSGTFGGEDGDDDGSGVAQAGLGLTHAGPGLSGQGSVTSIN